MKVKKFAVVFYSMPTESFAGASENYNEIRTGEIAFADK